MGGGGSGAFGSMLNNPTVQQHLQAEAMNQAQQGYNLARAGVAEAIQHFRTHVQEGPAGISILCFLGGVATTVIGAIGLLSVLSSATSPFTYVLNIYLTGFGIVTILLEADVESVRTLKILGKLAPVIERYQGEVFNRAGFLTELRGRGLYYIFVGNLAITQCFVCLLFLVGAWNLLMGILCLMMSFGINPAEHLDLSGGGQQHGQQHFPHGEPLHPGSHSPA